MKEAVDLLDWHAVSCVHASLLRSRAKVDGRHRHDVNQWPGPQRLQGGYHHTVVKAEVVAEGILCGVAAAKLQDHDVRSHGLHLLPSSRLQERGVRFLQSCPIWDAQVVHAEVGAK